ncbi:MAG: heme lyase CcmF/NrfE family subunit, partial [candidate division Zixibacteria bacterium]|nr:heme lyase CcmF/NrfE family subunit [candidate division Zixibacteria bacterium]
MIEIGAFAIFLALILAVYSGLSIVFGLRIQRGEMIKSSENGIKATLFCLTVASLAMIYALITRDFQVAYVTQYTNRSLPLVYTLTAFYAGQEGSLLFWAWLLSLFAAIVIWQNRGKNRDILPYVSLVLISITFFFLILMAFVTNPFEK